MRYISYLVKSSYRKIQFHALIYQVIQGYYMAFLYICSVAKDLSDILQP